MSAELQLQNLRTSAILAWASDGQGSRAPFQIRVKGTEIIGRLNPLSFVLVNLPTGAREQLVDPLHRGIVFSERVFRDSHS